MGVMVLNRQRRDPLFHRPLSRQVIGMQIVDDQFRFYLQNALQMADGLFEGMVGLEIFHIPNVRTQEGLILPRETDRIFKFTTHSQN